MIKVLLTICLIFTCVLARSGVANKQAASLLDELKGVADNRVKVDSYHHLALQYFNYDNEKAYEFASKALALAKEEDYLEGVQYALADIAFYYILVGDQQKARLTLDDGISVNIGSKNLNSKGYTFVRFADYYRKEAQFDSAAIFYEKARALLNDQNPSLELYLLNDNISWYHYELSNYYKATTSALRSVNKAINLGDSLLIAHSWGLMALIHSDMSNYDSAQYYFDLVNKVANSFESTELQIFYNLNQGELYFQQGEIMKALEEYNQALVNIDFNKMKGDYVKALNKIGHVLYTQGDFLRAEEYFFSALEVAEEINDQYELGKIFGYMGWMYINQGNIENARNYANKSLDIMTERMNSFGIAYALNLKGFVYHNNQAYDSALIFYYKAMLIRQNINYKTGVAATGFNIGITYEAMGNLEMALESLLNVAKQQRETISKTNLSFTLANIGKLYIKMDMLDKAEEYLSEAESIASEINSLVRLRECYNYYAMLYKRKGDDTKALLFLEKYVDLSDKLRASETIKQSARLNLLYQLNKKENEIELLKRANESTENALQAKEAELRLEERNTYYLAAVIFFLTLLVISVYRFYRHKKKANGVLKELNSILKEQNEEIQTQSEELSEKNTELSNALHSLKRLNELLKERSEEIESQTEQLQKANKQIAANNENLEKMVLKRTSELQKAYRELDTFFYRSSHDFRRPITTFLGLAEVAKITLDDENALDLFDKVNETARSLDKMLVKFQSISTYGEELSELTELSIEEFIKTICLNFLESFKRNGIKITTSIKRDFTFKTNAVLLTIILENLIENAIQFAGVEDRKIKILATQSNDMVEISIEDNGQGIDTRYGEQIFDMYFRANATSQGNGLGLYVAKKATEKLDGQITYISEIGKGSKFTLKIPYII